MPDSVTASYHAADGGEHIVAVERTPEGRWRVLDIADGSTVVVDTLTGHDDRLAQAETLARDHAEQHDHHSGRRTDDPLPKRDDHTADETPWAA
jgi:hypothetical protein